MLLVLVLVVAGLLLRAWHFRRAFRAELAHARRTGAPEPVYRNPFLGGYVSALGAGAGAGAEHAAVPMLWDEEMLEPSELGKLDEKDIGDGEGEMDTRAGKGKAQRVDSLAAVQPASLARYAYAPAPAPAAPAAQPPFSHEVREALRAFVPRKSREQEQESGAGEAAPLPRVTGEAAAGEIGVGVLIAMPRVGRWGADGVGEVSLGVLECRAE